MSGDRVVLRMFLFLLRKRWRVTVSYANVFRLSFSHFPLSRAAVNALLGKNYIRTHFHFPLMPKNLFLSLQASSGILLRSV